VERRSKRGHTGLRSNLRNPDGPSVRFPLSVGIIYAYLGKPREGNKKIPSPLFFAIIKVPSRQKPKLLVRFSPEN